MRRASFVFLLLFTGCHTSMYHGIPNFCEVSPGIYRGGQPTTEGWKYLASIGIRQDIKLNTESEGSDEEAMSLGIQIRRFPITLCQQTIGKPKFDDLWLSVQSIGPGTFVHCSHGQDRTGLIIGAYRVFNGWDKNRAFSEMMDHGFHPLLRGLCWSWEEDVIFPVDSPLRRD